jgi:hypothetical protein
MRPGNSIRLALVLLCFLTVPLFAQLQVGDNTSLNLSGNAGFGYTGVFDGTDMNSFTYGFNANLTGDYYDPRFLNFAVNPYLNQSNLNSNYNSSAFASGMSAMANFLSGSHTPVQAFYERTHNSEGTFNVPGSTGSYQTVGNGQTFGLNASYLPEDWPSITGSYSHTGTDYRVLGTPGTGTSHSNSLGVSSGYQLWGANLSGSYNKIYVSNDSPSFVDPNVYITQNTDQDTLQFSGSRRFFDIGTFSASYSRSHVGGDYEGYHPNATFDTVGAVLGVAPVNRLSLTFNVNYSSNLSAQYFSNIINGSANGASASAAQTEPVSYTSSYLDYGVNATYGLAKDLTIQGNVDRRVQGQPGLPDFASNIMGVGATWSHELLGGSFGAHYGISYYYSPVYAIANEQTSLHDSSFTGHNAAVSYSRRFYDWTGTGSFSYARSLTTVLVGYVQSNYAANLGVSRTLAKWTLALSGSYSNAHVEGITLSDSDSASGSVSLSHNNFGISGTYARSNGSALQVGNNVIPVPPPGSGPIPDLLVLFRGESWGVGGSYRPLKRWSIVGSYSHVRYNTENLAANSINISNQFYLRSEYSFRQLSFIAGINHLNQGFNLSTVQPVKTDTVYVGISRRFDFF